MSTYGFNPPHEMWILDAHKRCSRCGMLFSEIAEYELVLCPVGRAGCGTQRAHRNFKFDRVGDCLGFQNQPAPEHVVYARHA